MRRIDSRGVVGSVTGRHAVVGKASGEWSPVAVICNQPTKNDVLYMGLPL